MKGYRTSAHSKAGSALSEFIAGRLETPSAWPAENRRAPTFLRLPDELSSIQRWENEGGTTVAATALANRQTSALQYFNPIRPFLTQPI